MIPCNGNVFRVLKLPVSIYFPFSKLMLWPFSHEIRYFAKLSLACFVLDIYKKCWHMTSHWTMTFWNDVTLHNDFLKKLPDLGISCIEIIKPFICVVPTRYKSILYVDKFESVIYNNLALYRVSQKSDTIEIILLLWFECLSTTYNNIPNNIHKDIITYPTFGKLIIF
jgi:hypothetical protein